MPLSEHLFIFRLSGSFSSSCDVPNDGGGCGEKADDLLEPLDSDLVPLCLGVHALPAQIVWLI